ncbi:MAG: sugar phosphate isomerase/epimerase [Burkholderiales bacterium]|nr:sugar phosphate isomerase/epimerase [Opitutaceae bacterium]
MSAFPSFYTGFADEAGPDLATQIRATRELGWSAIELRNVRVPGHETANVHDIPDEAFELVVATLGEAGVRVNCLGSALANGAKDVRKPFDADEASARRAAVRGRRLGAEFVRVMSYPLGDLADLREDERFRRLREIVKIFAGSGVTVVHENCGNYGAMGVAYSLRLIEEVPGLRLVFDMGNTVSDLDYTKPAPHPRQSAWEFYQGVRDHIAYVHIKDAVWNTELRRKDHVFPGEGEADVRRIVTNLRATSYANAFSIEPHMHAGLANRPDLSVEENHYQTYVEYGRRLMNLVAEIDAIPARAS